MSIESEAREANRADLWDALWRKEGRDTWRKAALVQVYTRIERLMPKGARVVDLGGGIGVLGERLHAAGHSVTVYDHSDEALRQAQARGLYTAHVDLEHGFGLQPDVIVVSTETIEHLSASARTRIFTLAAIGHQQPAFFSVPNARLGHEEEHQHAIEYTAKSFLDELRRYYGSACRVEVLGPYLLGVCGFEKPFKLSVTFPARDEADDIEATLASFRGVADELVVGIDPRTQDSTRDIAAKYADVLFDLNELRGPPGNEVPEGGFHFSHARNQCIERCSGDWIFMTEAHERLVTGENVLLQLDACMPEGTKVGFVLRSGTGQQWAFPWLFKRDSRIRFRRATHNMLDYPDGYMAVKLPQVRTLHERSAERAQARAVQRKAQNRRTLMEDWLLHENTNSLFYLGQEWREYDEERAIRYLEEYLRQPARNGVQRYQARLMLAKMYARREQFGDARRVLLDAHKDDWSRTEHFIWLGDIAFTRKQHEEALQWYRYAGTCAGEPPFTIWWIDLACYSYLPAQRLAMVYAELGRAKDALHWARESKRLLPDDAPSVVVEEHECNIALLEGVLNAK